MLSYLKFTKTWKTCQMKFKDKIILGLLLVLFASGICWAGRYILRSGDVIYFDKITRYGVDDLAGVGLDGDDTSLWLDMDEIDTGVQLITVIHPIQKTGTEDQPDISFSDTYTYTLAELDDKFTDLDTAKYDSTLVYTQAEADALLLDKADTPHDHNNLYYTESESDTLLLAKADTPHAHDDRYYTESESDSLLDAKADTPHNHDDRYFIESELDTSLVGYWKFDDKGDVSASGESANADTAYDQTSNNNDGTIHNCMWGDTSNDDSAVWGGGLSFNGSSDYVEIPHSTSLNITDAITVEAWVKPVIMTGGLVVRFLVEKGASKYYIGIRRDLSAAYFLVKSGDVSYGSGDTSALSAGQWHHLVGVYDGANVKIFLDNVETVGDALTGDIDIDANILAIGRAATADNRHVNGAIDEVRIYSRALSADEIAAHADKYNTWSNFSTALDAKLDIADSPVISDVAYNATSWNANTDAASKNTIRDKINTMDTAIGLNTAKSTNVSTALSEGTRDDTTYGITSDGGADDLVLPQANTNQAGLLSGTKFDEIVANTLAKHSQNTDTDLDATFEATFMKKADNVNELADITSTGANIEDAVTKKHTHANQSLLDGIAADSTLNSGQKAAIDLNTTDRHASASDNQNLWEEIRTDTGTTSANSQTDTLWITGGSDVMVTNSGDTIIIDYTGTGGAGATAWGAITGTLSSQTDLEARFTQGWKERQLLAFRQNNYEYMIDGFNNPFDVENEGIDTALSDTYLYNAAGDYYYQESDSTTTLDMMEYASDALAQAAYVSSDGYGSDILTGGTASADSIYGAGQEADKACDNNEATNWHAATPPSFPNWWKYDLGVAVTKIVTKLRIKPKTGRVKDFTLQGSNNDSDWTVIHTGQHANNATWEDYIFINTTAYRYYKIVISNNWTAETSIGEIEMIEANLQSYFSTTKTQGTYALKCVAVKDDSLADTIYHTFSPAIDLTDKTQIKLDTRATITGQNFTVKIHDSGGTTTTHAVTIADTSVYQTDTWDISGVSNANKDAIDQILIEIDNADTPNTFYLDNVYENLLTGGNMELYTSENFTIGLVPVTVKALIFANQTPTSVKLSRLPTGTSLTTGVLADTDIESATLNAYTYTADVSGESSDTGIRALIVADTNVIQIHGISILGLE